MEGPGGWKVLDAVGSGVVALVLLAMSGWCAMVVLFLPAYFAMFAEMNGTELPNLTRLVYGLSQWKILHGATVLLLLGGFGCLFLIRDRLRANVYALAMAMLSGALAGVILIAAWLPLFRVIQDVSKETWRNMFKSYNNGICLQIVGSPEGGHLKQAISSVCEKIKVDSYELGNCLRSEREDGKNEVLIRDPWGDEHYYDE